MASGRRSQNRDKGVVRARTRQRDCLGAANRQGDRAVASEPVHNAEQTIAPLIIPPVLALRATGTRKTVLALPDVPAIIGENDMSLDHEVRLWPEDRFGLDSIMPVPDTLAHRAIPDDAARGSALRNPKLILCRHAPSEVKAGTFACHFMAAH